MSGDLYVNEHTITDGQTGEMISKTRTSLSKQPKEQYIRLFIDTVSAIAGARLSGGEHDVLYMLQKYTINNSNLLFYNVQMREQIAKDLKMKPETVRKCVSRLVSAEMLIREKRLYFLNPVHFGRGDWQNVHKLRKNLSLEFDFKKQETKQIVQTEAFYKNEDEILDDVKTAKSVEIKDSFNVDTNTLERTALIEEKSDFIDIVEVAEKPPIKSMSLMGMLNGKIGDTDPKDIRKKVVDKQIKKAGK